MMMHGFVEETPSMQPICLVLVQSNFLDRVSNCGAKIIRAILMVA